MSSLMFSVGVLIAGILHLPVFTRLEATVEVEQQWIGWLLGSRGAVMKEIEQASGAKISIDQSTKAKDSSQEKITRLAAKSDMSETKAELARLQREASSGMEQKEEQLGMLQAAVASLKQEIERVESAASTAAAEEIAGLKAKLEDMLQRQDQLAAEQAQAIAAKFKEQEEEIAAKFKEQEEDVRSVSQAVVYLSSLFRRLFGSDDNDTDDASFIQLASKKVAKRGDGFDGFAAPDLFNQNDGDQVDQGEPDAPLQE